MKWTDLIAFTIATFAGVGMVALAVVAWAEFKVDPCLACGIGFFGILMLCSVSIRENSDGTTEVRL